MKMFSQHIIRKQFLETTFSNVDLPHNGRPNNIIFQLPFFWINTTKNVHKSTPLASWRGTRNLQMLTVCFVVIVPVFYGENPKPFECAISKNTPRHQQKLSWVFTSILHLFKKGSRVKKTTSANKVTLLGKNISHPKALLKMFLLFPRWDMLISLEGI